MGEKIFKKIGKYLVPYLVASMINGAIVSDTYAKRAKNTKFAEQVMKEANTWYNLNQDYVEKYRLNSFFPAFRRMEEYRSYIERAAKESGLDKCILMGLIAVESQGILRANSYAKAGGPMQLLVGFARKLRIPMTKWEDRRYSVDSIPPAAKKLAELIEEYGLVDALIAYNAGEDDAQEVDNIEKWKHKRKYIPRQTKDYVPKVMAAIKACRIYEEQRNNSIVKVKPGDNLLKIVEECEERGFDVNLRKIKQINHIDNQNKIYVGQTIYCSGEYNKDIYANARNYRVARGDNLETIARKFGVSTYDIVKLNPQVIDWSMLKPGMVLRVPKQRIQEASQIRNKPSTKTIKKSALNQNQPKKIKTPPRQRRSAAYYRR
ncbi:MAG: LysM peptidoglycan-binding domain-containing protein [Candidatus Pacearchaeota archaeon]